MVPPSRSDSWWSTQQSPFKGRMIRSAKTCTASVSFRLKHGIFPAVGYISVYLVVFNTGKHTKMELIFRRNYISVFTDCGTAREHSQVQNIELLRWDLHFLGTNPNSVISSLEDFGWCCPRLALHMRHKEGMLEWIKSRLLYRLSHELLRTLHYKPPPLCPHACCMQKGEFLWLSPLKQGYSKSSFKLT